MACGDVTSIFLQVGRHGGVAEDMLLQVHGNQAQAEGSWYDFTQRSGPTTAQPHLPYVGRAPEDGYVVLCGLYTIQLCSVSGNVCLELLERLRSTGVRPTAGSRETGVSARCLALLVRSAVVKMPP